MRTRVAGVQSGPLCGAWAWGAVPRVQDVDHRPSELDGRLVDAFRKFPETERRTCSDPLRKDSG